MHSRRSCTPETGQPADRVQPSPAARTPLSKALARIIDAASGSNRGGVSRGRWVSPTFPPPTQATPCLAVVLVLLARLCGGVAVADDLVRNESIHGRWVSPTVLEYRWETPEGTVLVHVDAISGVALPVLAPAEGPDLAPGRANRSLDLGGEVHLTFHNRLDSAVRLVWIDRQGGRVPYGSVAPGASHRQHTFAGHAWLALDPEGDVLAGWVAPGHDAVVSIDPAAIDGWKDLRSANRRSNRGTTNDGNPPAPRIMVRGHDVFTFDPDGTERRLTDDGTADSPWSPRTHASPDGRFILAMKIDAPERHPVHIVAVAPNENADDPDDVEPTLRTLDYLKPGDRIAHPHPAVIELSTGRRIELDPTLAPTPWSIDSVSWHPSSDRVRLRYNQRGHQVLRLLEIDTRSGESRVLIEETSPTFLDYAAKSFLHVMREGDHAIWMSERSGWNHLELVDLTTGDRRPLTSGDWVVRAVDDVDEDAGTIRIRLMGIDPDQDPYHVHHAIVDLAAGALTRLTRGDGTHEIEFSPDGRFYVDRWSRVDLPPVHELRRTSDGSLVAELARADASGLLATNWTMPERFVAKGRDGETDIWGVIVRPREFDPSESYPVVEHIYAGPQSHFVPKSWSRHWRMREVADQGLVVVQIDGMGTNWRSKAFHDVASRNLGDSGFPDRIAWMRAASADRPWMNLDRVGIYGGSAGGQSALRALLAHGDFYDVAVADCGCHDNRMDKVWWNELWMGWPIGPHYAEQSNVTNAHRLQGDLMLILGGLDENVDPASTLQVVDALVKADKDFEFVLLPSAGHGAAETAYGHRRRLDFLRRTLLDD
jgi:dipeptidyl-peptidase-4